MKATHDERYQSEDRPENSPLGEEVLKEAVLGRDGTYTFRGKTAREWQDEASKKEMHAGGGSAELEGARVVANVLRRLENGELILKREI